MARKGAGRNGDASSADSFAVTDPLGLAEASAHYIGHRERLRERFRQAGADALPDYELLELVLFRAVPRADVKPLAKSLIDRFGSFAEVVAAAPGRLREVKGVGDAIVTELKLIGAAVERVTRGKVRERPVLSSWSAVLAHCRAAMAFAEQEQFRMLSAISDFSLLGNELEVTSLKRP